MAPESLGDPDRQDLTGNLEPSHFSVVLSPTGTADRRLSLTGSWRSDEVAVVEVGSTSVTYLGCCLAERQKLHHRAVHALATGHLAELTELPGSFHVLVSSPDMFAVFGDVVGLRQVFYARLGGSWLVSDRADVVASRIGAALNDEWLALWLVWPPPGLWPPASLWDGVATVPPGSCLMWRRVNHQSQVEPYWVPPAPSVPLHEGAQQLSAALSTAIGERMRRAVSPSCDLSGGKDTTALAFLAAEAARSGDDGTPGHDDRVLAITLPSVSPDNDDARWAQTVAGSLEAVDHIMVPALECPLPYDDIDDPVRGLDHPSVGTALSAPHRNLARQLVQAGRGDDHLSGHGGDEVLEAPLAYVRSLLPRRPWLAARRLRQHCALADIPIRSAARRVLRPGSYGRWLSGTAASLAAGGHTIQQTAADFGWGTLPPVPPWLTDHAVLLAASVLERAAQTTTPLSRHIAHHATLARIHAGAATARLHQQFMANLGVRLHCPYFDRSVVEAAVAVRAHERTSPSTFKPLLDAATASRVPEHLRARTTKGHYTEDIAWGFYRNRDRVAGVIANARLADRGLIDTGIAHHASQAARGPEGSILALADMLSCERWLRSVEESV